MDAIAADLAEYLVERLRELPPSRRLLVGLSGIPASGKSTLARLIVEHASEELRAVPELGASAVLVGLDGWHLTRAQLDKLPDPRLAHDRRGAHWTFDGAGYAAFVAALREDVAVPHSRVRASWHADDYAELDLSFQSEATLGEDDFAQPSSLPSPSSMPFSPISPSTITAPSFDHAIKDPMPGAVKIRARHRLVVIEGLYTFLSVDPWKEAGEVLDERWLVELDEDEARRRLLKRHILTGVARSLREAIWRADTNDMPNGRYILEHSLEPTRRIPSVEDPVLANL